MGRAKADLPWRGSTLLRCTVELLGRATGGPVVVVRAPGQELPPLPPGARVVEDPVEGRGPLQGLATGLGAADLERAFVCSTDLPFLVEAYVRRVLAGLDDDTDVALPVVHGHRQPLAAGYRTSLAPLCADLVAQGLLKPAALFAQVRTRVLDEAELLADPATADADPDLRSVVGVNTPEEYEAALLVLGR